jgi:thiamine kinase-like enzyme
MKRLKEIADAFEENGIVLKGKLDDSKECVMQDSVTNKYMKVEDIDENKYLIRINGKLWPPFTREDENFNLKQLKENNIDTSVIVNKHKLGFQICRLSEENKKFSELTETSNKEKAINKIALGMKKFHKIGNFKNHYPVANTINSSLKRVPGTEQKKLTTYHELLLTMFSTLNSDQKNMVSAHNDLLPSSIYVDEAQISFVDWEYSAENHRSYDLSLFSIKSSLSPEEEKQLVSTYDATGKLDMQYSVSVMRPIINYLLLLWNLSSKQPDAIKSSWLLSTIITNIQDAIYKQSARTLVGEMKLSLFHKDNPGCHLNEDNVLSEKAISSPRR